MLEVKNLTKIYKMEDYEQKALDNVSLNFRQSEFVSILGQSGSGKSTLLNIIGGLDHYTSGDLIINGVSTKNYTQSDWDTYRNHRIGFIFQNYNLINHQNLLSNVELAMTLTGVSKSERKRRAKEELEKVGLGKFINKRPSQLSGGQVQRVAIARALVNEPDIILADEPTGALDSETSVQIMDLLKDIAKDKLVIMVTHNAELAKEYSTRIINLKDGKILDDTKPFNGNEGNDVVDNKKRSSMSLLTALSLSKNNLITKKGRTLITAIAGSIGILGISLVLGLSNGVKEYANKMESETFGTQAISIERTAYDSSVSTLNIGSTEEKKAHDNSLLAVDDVSNNMQIADKLSTKTNNLKKFKEYVDENKEQLKDITSNIQYTYDIDINIYDKGKDENITKINPVKNNGTSLFSGVGEILHSSFKLMLDESNYELVSGSMPKAYNELVLIVNENEEINLSTLYSLNIKDRAEVSELLQKASEGEKVELENSVYNYDQIIGKKYKLINGADYYKLENNTWVNKENDTNFIKQLYDNGTELKIVGIAKTKSDKVESSFVGYTDLLNEYLISNANEKQIVKEQLKNPEINVFTGVAFDEVTSKYDDNLKILDSGSINNPNTINLYPKSLESKQDIEKFINDYNEKANDEDKITYVDQMKSLVGTIEQVVKIISIVLIALVSISLVVSSLMIGIITYVSVLERTKEIGILRAIGASQKDVKRVFRAETIIEGLASGILGVGVAYLLSMLVNAILSIILKIDGLMVISFVHAIILIALSMLLTVVAGAWPARIASKKDPVESLKTE